MMLERSRSHQNGEERGEGRDDMSNGVHRQTYPVTRTEPEGMMREVDEDSVDGKSDQESEEERKEGEAGDNYGVGSKRRGWRRGTQVGRLSVWQLSPFSGGPAWAVESGPLSTRGLRGGTTTTVWREHMRDDQVPVPGELDESCSRRKIQITTAECLSQPK